MRERGLGSQGPAFWLYVVSWISPACVLALKDKLLIDEDAPKKSVTDALIKCASYLGFAGDIFSGRWDDSKYVQQAGEEWEARRRAAEPKPMTDDELLEMFRNFALDGTAVLKAAYTDHMPSDAFWKEHGASLKLAAQKADHAQRERVAA